MQCCMRWDRWGCEHLKHLYGSKVWRPKSVVAASYFWTPRRKTKDIERFQNTVVICCMYLYIVFFLPQMCGLLQRGDLHSLFVDLLAPGEMSETLQCLTNVCRFLWIFLIVSPLSILNHVARNCHHMSVSTRKCPIGVWKKCIASFHMWWELRIDDFRLHTCILHTTGQLVLWTTYVGAVASRQQSFQIISIYILI